MAFFKVETTDENIRDSGDNGSYLNKSGMYEVLVKYACVEQSKNGSMFINLWVEYAGLLQPIFQAMRITNNDGSPNFGAKLFTKLCVVAGIEGDVDDPVDTELPIGKQGEMKECKLLEQFCDLPLFIHLRMEYSLYEGKIQQARVIRNVFRYEDKASASEIINDSEDKGKQYNSELEYCTKTIYKDGLEEEDIKEWLKDLKDNKSEEKKKESKGFGQKRSFGKRN